MGSFSLALPLRSLTRGREEGQQPTLEYSKVTTNFIKGNNATLIIQYIYILVENLQEEL